MDNSVVGSTFKGDIDHVHFKRLTQCSHEQSFWFGTSEMDTDAEAKIEEWQFPLASTAPVWPIQDENDSKLVGHDSILDLVDEVWDPELWTEWDTRDSINALEDVRRSPQVDKSVATINTAQLLSPTSQFSNDSRLGSDLSSPSQDHLKFEPTYSNTSRNNNSGL